MNRATSNLIYGAPFILLALLIAMLAGCATAPAGEYVRLDRQNYEATAPLLEDLIDNALKPHSAVSMLPGAIDSAKALLDQADESEDPMEANTLRMQAMQVLRDATTTKYFPPEEAQIWRDGLVTWLGRIEAAEALAKAGE